MRFVSWPRVVWRSRRLEGTRLLLEVLAEFGEEGLSGLSVQPNSKKPMRLRDRLFIHPNKFLLCRAPRGFLKKRKMGAA